MEPLEDHVPGPGRVGKSHMHNNVAGKPVQGPLASTVGMEAVTLECAAMRTGDATGQWSQHQDTGDSQVVQALAAACANEQAVPDRPSAGSISDTVGTLLARPSTRDPAVAASSTGTGISSAASAGTSAKSSTQPEPEPAFARAAKQQPPAAAEARHKPAPQAQPHPARAENRSKPPVAAAATAPAAKSADLPKISATQAEAIRRLAGNLKTRDSLIIEGWDVGGQPIFAVLHHLYMTRYSFFCELFDMRQLVPDAEQRFPDAFPDVPHGVSPRKHALAALRFWLNSIVVHTAGAEQEDDLCAPFVLVGTHKDIVQSAQDHMQISKLLHDTFGSHPAWPKLQRNRTQTGGQKNMLWFFPIDNTAGHADPVLGMLLAVIEQAIREEKYVHRRIPISWYSMYDELQRVLNSDQPTISFKQAVELPQLLDCKPAENRRSSKPCCGFCTCSAS